MHFFWLTARTGPVVIKLFSCSTQVSDPVPHITLVLYPFGVNMYLVAKCF